MKLKKRARTSTLNQTAPPVPAAVARYSPDLDQWPRSWMGVKKDIAAGEQIVTCFQPFLAELAGSGLTPKTVRKHVDNLWVLGGELIRDLNETPRLRKRLIADLVFDAVEDGGLLPHQHDSEEQLRSFESTCRRYRRFLEQQGRQ